ncbi:MAG: HAMP domain-containing sensor histidine kinase [Cyanobacteria bacterium P01_A01_bin.84]
MELGGWIYFAIGLVLGIGIDRLIQFSQKGRTDFVTEQKASDGELKKISEQLKHIKSAYNMANEMCQFKGGFLARTTHELRSPLNGLIGLHQLILQDLCENPEEEREFIAQAHERTLLLLKLLDGILKVARTEHGTNKLNIVSYPVGKLLQEVDDLTRMLAQNRNFPFKVSAPESEIYVSADIHWLRQILLGLIENTIGQMEEGSIHLCAEASSTGNMTEIFLDIPKYTLPDKESIDLIKSDSKYEQKVDKNSSISHGMKLLINQTLIETMGGNLQIVSAISNGEYEPDMVRLKLSIPRGTHSNELLQLEENQA